jgi:hypothetical protein
MKVKCMTTTAQRIKNFTMDFKGDKPGSIHSICHVEIPFNYYKNRNRINAYQSDRFALRR